jgi:ATP-dependent helicase HepA
MVNSEIARLKALRQINPNVRNEEIEFFIRQLQALTLAFDSARVRLDALRVIIST